MKKIIVLALLAVFMMPLTVSQVFAAAEQTEQGITDVGNTMCPVMGGPVSGENFVVYKNKRYALCCPMCEKTFLNDPVRYSAKASASAAPVTPDVPKSEEMEKDMEQGSF